MALYLYSVMTLWGDCLFVTTDSLGKQKVTKKTGELWQQDTKLYVACLYYVP